MIRVTRRDNVLHIETYNGEMWIPDNVLCSGNVSFETRRLCYLADHLEKQPAAALKASTPAAPGIDLEQFREAVEYRYSAELAAFERGCRNENQLEHAESERTRLLTLIDASHNGGRPEVTDVMVNAALRVQYARAGSVWTGTEVNPDFVDMRHILTQRRGGVVIYRTRGASVVKGGSSVRAKFEAWLAPSWSQEGDTDEDGDFVYREDWVQGAWIGYQAAMQATSHGAGVLDASPKGGSTSDCPIIRLAPGEYTDWEKRVWRRGVIECATQSDIAAAMQATSAEVGS